MTTWAMKKRFEWIAAKLEAGEAFNRSDIGEAFYTTKQTATATIARFEREHPGRLRYDGARKAFVRSDAPSTSRQKLIADELVSALQAMVYHYGDRSVLPPDYQPTCVVGAKDAAYAVLAKAAPVALAVRALEEKAG